MNTIIGPTSHTVRSMHCCQLSSTRIFAVIYDQLTKSSDETSTENYYFVLVLVLVDEKTLILLF